MEIPHKQVEELLREAAEEKIMPLWQNLRRGDGAEGRWRITHRIKHFVAPIQRPVD